MEETRIVSSKKHFLGIICRDPELSDPRKEYDHIGVMLCVPHRNCRLGDRQCGVDEQPVPPTRYASAGWTVEDLTYRYGVSKSVARDTLLAVSEELQYAMRRAGWEVINAAMAKK